MFVGERYARDAYLGDKRVLKIMHGDRQVWPRAIGGTYVGTGLYEQGSYGPIGLPIGNQIGAVATLSGADPQVALGRAGGSGSDWGRLLSNGNWGQQFSMGDGTHGTTMGVGNTASGGLDYAGAKYVYQGIAGGVDYDTYIGDGINGSLVHTFAEPVAFVMARRNFTDVNQRIGWAIAGGGAPAPARNSTFEQQLSLSPDGLKLYAWGTGSKGLSRNNIGYGMHYVVKDRPVVTGSFIGDDTTDRVIELGAECNLVFFAGADDYSGGGVPQRNQTPGVLYVRDGSNCPEMPCWESSGTTHTDGGKFAPDGRSLLISDRINNSNFTYLYVGF